jgi:hypothetical protein
MALNQSTSLIELFARLFWLMIGPAILLLLAYAIAANQKGWFAPMSIGFLVVLAGMIMARRSDPHDGAGDPTTLSQLRRYTVCTIGLGIVAWVVVNLLGNYWLAS